MSLGPARRGIFTFTAGFPDAGSTLTRKFVQPASVTTAAAIGAAAQITDASGTGSPAIPQSQEHLLAPTQPMPSFSQESIVPETQEDHEQNSEKRQRVNGEEQEQSQPFTRSRDHRDMVQYFHRAAWHAANCSNGCTHERDQVGAHQVLGLAPTNRGHQGEDGQQDQSPWLEDHEKCHWGLTTLHWSS